MAQSEDPIVESTEMVGESARSGERRVNRKSAEWRMKSPCKMADPAEQQVRIPSGACVVGQSESPIRI